MIHTKDLKPEKNTRRSASHNYYNDNETELYKWGLNKDVSHILNLRVR